MIVHDIDWISDPEDREAFVLVGGRTLTLWAFSHPCDLSVGSLIVEPLSGLDCLSYIAEKESEDFVELVDKNSRSYTICGIVARKEPKVIVYVDGILINISYLSADIRVGDRILMQCARIDV